jgi:hypothetical protein
MAARARVMSGGIAARAKIRCRKRESTRRHAGVVAATVGAGANARGAIAGRKRARGGEITVAVAVAVGMRAKTHAGCKRIVEAGAEVGIVIVIDPHNAVDPAARSAKTRWWSVKVVTGAAVCLASTARAHRTSVAAIVEARGAAVDRARL